MQRIITVTINPAIDINMEVQQIAPDRKIRSNIAGKEPGGGGINVSRALARLGKKSTTLTTYGGESGKKLIDLLNEEQIDCVPIKVSGSTRENYNIKENEYGALYRFIVSGPKFYEADILACYEKISTYVEKGDFLVMSGSLPTGVPDDFYAKIISNANDKGALCVVDTSGEPLIKAANARVFLLKPNLRELGQLAGKKITDEKELMRVAMDLIEKRFCKILVVSLGSEGALLVSRDVQRKIKNPDVPVVSKVGAGDSMIAGILYGLSENYKIEKTVQFGIAAGAAAVTTPGTEFCRKEDTIHIFEQIQKEYT